MKRVLLAATISAALIQAAAAQVATAPGAFATLSPNIGTHAAMVGMTSNIVGLSVYNDQKQDIGTVKDIAIDPNGVRAFIVGVGGFLGMGDHYVAVNPSALKIRYDSSAKKWAATMDATKAQLKAAPEFKYSGAWDAGKS